MALGFPPLCFELCEEQSSLWWETGESKEAELVVTSTSDQCLLSDTSLKINTSTNRFRLFFLVKSRWIREKRNWIYIVK